MAGPAGAEPVKPRATGGEPVNIVFLLLTKDS